MVIRNTIIKITTEVKYNLSLVSFLKTKLASALDEFIIPRIRFSYIILCTTINSEFKLPPPSMYCQIHLIIFVIN